MKRYGLLILVLLLSLSTLLGCGSGSKGTSVTQQKYEMILSSEVPADHFKSKLMQQFADEITKRTNGGIKAKFYPAGQLYSDIEALRSLGTGAVHSVWPVSVQLETFNPAYGVLTLPFAVTDENMMKDDYRTKLLNMLSPLVQSNGMKVLGLLRTADLMFIAQKKEMKSYEDLSGMKIRMTGGKVLLEMAKQLNASAVNIPASEMSTALSQGVVNAVFSSPSGWKTILGPSVKYGYYVPGLNVQTYSIVIDEKWYNNLPAEYQQEIVKLVNEIALNQWKESIISDNKLLDELKQKGVVVHEESKENIEKLKQKFQPAYELFAKDYPEVYKQFQSISK